MSRVALVTGGGGGIGRAVALRLAKEGAAIAIWGLDQAPLDAVTAEVRRAGAASTAFQCDVTDPEQVRAAMQHTQAALGGVDLLINSAGIGVPSEPVYEASLATFRRVVDVNLTGTFICMQAVLPGMRERRFGRVVNIASQVARKGARKQAAYAASKHAVLGLTRSAALDLAEQGITVNAVCPSWVETEMVLDGAARVARATGREVAAVLADWRNRNPQRRFLEPGEVAEVVAFLCSDGAGGISGQSWGVDGGELTA